jgi:hypothetical protein
MPLLFRNCKIKKYLTQNVLSKFHAEVSLQPYIHVGKLLVSRVGPISGASARHVAIHWYQSASREICS